MDKIQEMRIAKVDPRAWKFMVGPTIGYNVFDRQIPATFVSGTPLSLDGTGMHALPRVGDPCLVLIKENGDAYILGYFMYSNTRYGGCGGVLPKEGMEPGAINWTTGTGGFFRTVLNGSWHWGVDIWSKLYLGMFNQEIRGWFRNVGFRVKGGHFFWESNKDGETKYTSSITRSFEDDINNDMLDDVPRAPVAVEENGVVPEYVDKVIRKIAHKDKPFVIDEIRTADKVFKKQHLVPAGADLDIELKAPGRTVTIKVLDNNYVSISCASGESEAFCTLGITEDSITIGHTGEILLGGEGEEQQLVTKKFVEDIFMTHTHLGNNGAPTSAPLNVGEILIPVSRAGFNHFTLDTKAE